MIVKNIAPRGDRGIAVAGALVWLAPGEERELDVAAEDMADAPYFSFDGKVSAPELPATGGPASDPDDPTAALDKSTIAELTALAAAENITLPETGTGDGGRVLKADMVKAITDARAAAAAPAGDADPLDAMGDDDLRATVQALTGEPAPADADRTALLALARGASTE